MKTLEKPPFNARLSKEQKEFFEYAANLGGFRTLSEFVLFSVQEQAHTIVEKYNLILASKKDQKIFFDSIINPQKPNDRLKKAAIRFKKAVVNK